MDTKFYKDHNLNQVIRHKFNTIVIHKGGV